MAADAVQSPSGQSSAAPVTSGEREPDGFPAVAERYGPAVVHIRAQSRHKLPIVEVVDPADPLVAFFKTSVPQAPPAKGGVPSVMTGAGSGFIASADGLILTTAHVVAHADDVTVTLTDHRSFHAKVLSVDAASDVAILRIEASNLPVVRLGEASHVRIGEPVLAIGTTDAGSNMLTAGMVSAAPCTLVDGKRFGFFQTEVPADPDNSGGPLLNQAGQVIGIGVQLYPDGNRDPGMTFAIPVDTPNALLKALQSLPDSRTGPIQESLGLNVQDVSPRVIAAIGLATSPGVLVNTVEPKSPAAAAGIMPGDIIVQVGDSATGTVAAFADAVTKLQSGATAAAQLVRARQRVSVAVTIRDARNAVNGEPDTGDVDRPGQVTHAPNGAEKCTRDLPPALVMDAVQEAPAAQLDQYQVAVAQYIEERNPSDVLHGSPQAMLRSVVVVSFIVDRDGHVLESSVYRTNGDGDAERAALASLRRSSPLPQPPAQLLNGRGQVELFEDWLFNDNRKFQLRELAPPQAQTLN
jgi:TonB family protein